MKKLLILFAITLLIANCTVYASGKNIEEINKQKLRTLQGNSIFIEGGGNAFAIGSLNYERMLFHSNKFYLTSRFGFGALSIGQDKDEYYNYFFPLLLNFQFQLSNSLIFEFGGGTTFAKSGWVEQNHYSGNSEIYKYHNTLITGLIGVRVQTEKGFLFRVGFTPIYNKQVKFNPRFTFLPWGGLSIGYSFGK